VHSFVENTLAELNRIRGSLETQEAHHQTVVDELRAELDKEASEGRDAADQFWHEFEHLVHERCSAVAEGLQAMENNQKYAHNVQQKALDSLEGDVKTLRKSLRDVSGCWGKFRARNESRQPLAMSRSVTMVRGSSRADALAQVRRLQAEKAVKEVYDLVERLRSRLRVMSGGLAGQEWSRTFKSEDMNETGQISLASFCRVVRERLKIVDVPDEQLHVVFDSLDEDGSGDISIDELVAFVADPTIRMRGRIRAAAAGVSAGKDGLSEILGECDKDGSGEISYNEFKLMCRARLKLLDGDIHLRAVFDAVDKNGSGMLSIDEFLTWMNRH